MRTDRQFIFTHDSKFSLAKPEGKSPLLEGYALVWNTLSTDRGGYKVRLKPNSAEFATPTLALFHHNFQNVLGNTENGTLRLKQDDHGVKFEIDLPDTMLSRDVQELVSKGYIRGMSFSMASAPEGNSVTENGQTIFDATKFLVDEITVTAIPAFAPTQVGVGSTSKFSARDAQQLELQRFRFGSLRLPGAELPCAAK